jgi:hypothetical protein
MNWNRKRRRHRRQNVFERIEAALQYECDRRRDDPERLLQQEEKLTRVRLALFGCAPK